MKIRCILMMLLMLLTVTADAKKPKYVRKQKLTAEEQARQEKLDRMLATTERVLFIDSFVVDKNQFLQCYKMNSDLGQIKHTSDVLRNYQYSDSYAYINGLGSLCYLSKHDTDSTSQLYISENEDGLWVKPSLIAGINDDKSFQQVNYPFIMGDGQTLYFAANGPQGIGGYDIYMTSYDSENDTYLHPVNIGMPFNSEANDYMYVIDEYDSLGWFVTDRRQPEDKVCVYVFVPSSTRLNYDESEYEPEQLTAFAQISSIRDTWFDEQRVLAARQRLKQKGTKTHPARKDHRRPFVINDRVTYYQASDFRHPENSRRYQQWLSLIDEQQQLATSLEKSRRYYSQATQRERQQLKTEILTDEQKSQQLQQQIRQIEKIMRNAENIFIN